MVRFYPRAWVQFHILPSVLQYVFFFYLLILHSYQPNPAYDAERTLPTLLTRSASSIYDLSFLTVARKVVGQVNNSTRTARAEQLPACQCE